MSDPMPMRLADDVLMQELSDGEAVFLDLRQEHYFGLDRIGTALLKAALRHRSVDGAVEEVQDAFEAPAEVLRADLLELIASLEHRGIIVSHAWAADPQPPAP